MLAEAFRRQNLGESATDAARPRCVRAPPRAQVAVRRGEDRPAEGQGRPTSHKWLDPIDWPDDRERTLAPTLGWGFTVGKGSLRLEVWMESGKKLSCRTTIISRHPTDGARRGTRQRTACGTPSVGSFRTGSLRQGAKKRHPSGSPCRSPLASWSFTSSSPPTLLSRCKNKRPDDRSPGRTR